MSRRGQLRPSQGKWWRVHLPLGEKPNWQPRKYSTLAGHGAELVSTARYFGVAYFPVALYPTKASLPVRRIEIPIWDHLDG